MNRLLGVIVGFALLLTFVNCGDDDGTGPDTSSIVTPQSPAGLMEYDGVSSYQFVMGWLDSARSDVDGYNAYKSIGNGSAVRQNIAPLVEDFLFGLPDSATSLHYRDTALNSSSNLVHRYWVTAVKAGKESSASDTVVFIPAEFDSSNHISGLTPDGAQGVARVPTFSWDAMAGASSYAIHVQTGPDGGPGRTVWMYRTTSTQCVYQEESGITTYADLNQTTLPANQEIGWALAAFNDDNFGFALSFGGASASFMTGP